MSIDPRYLEELLKLRFKDPSGLLNGSSKPDSASGNEFRELFESLLQTGVDSNVAVNTISNAPSGNSALDAMKQRNNHSMNITDYDQIIHDAAARYGVDERLIRAVIQTESGYHANAVSESGAKGLMQLMDETAEALGVRDSFDPEQNILGGTKFLGYLLRKYEGNEAIALAAYNAGPGKIDRLGIDSPEQLAARFELLPEETQNYITKVLNIASLSAAAGH